MFTYEYARPAVTVDSVVLAWDGESLQVLLIERAGEPFACHWALPGGFVEMDESLEEAARRELEEETGIAVDGVEQVGAFGRVDRDPRGRVISVALVAAIPFGDARIQAASDARRAGWFAVNETPPLAFDHAQILKTTLFRLREQIRHHVRGVGWLPASFTVAELKKLYEAILEEPISVASLRRRLENSPAVVPAKTRDGATPRFRFRKAAQFGSLLGSY